MKLSLREQSIFKLMVKRAGEDVPLDDIMSFLGMDSTRNNRTSVNQSIKILSYKLSPDGYTIERISNLGASVKALYRLTTKQQQRQLRDASARG